MQVLITTGIRFGNSTGFFWPFLPAPLRRTFSMVMEASFKAARAGAPIVMVMNG